MAAEGETLDDVHLIRLTEVIGPLPQQIFPSWRRGSRYFDASSRRTYNPEGCESFDGGSYPDSDKCESQDGRLESEDGESTFSEHDTFTSDSEDELARERLCEPLEYHFRRKKPKDIDGVEAKQILHMLRWILQYDPAKRPSAEEILRHEWFQTWNAACIFPAQKATEIQQCLWVNLPKLKSFGHL